GRARNRALTFGPEGTLLGVSDKAFLDAGPESRIGLTPGRIEDLRPFGSPVGPVGVAICLDAFHDEVVGRLDGQGARILVQPSANLASWTRPWPPDPRLLEGEAWWRHGLPRALHARQHLRAGVNPMLVGSAFGLTPRGRSTIVVAGAAGVDGLPDGIVAVAPSDDEAAIVRTVTTLPLGYARRPT
ncbi:MAG: nitrilase-related carbon-nitrogen hydrolase, partial [Trueperaceae bacterium]